MDIMQAIAVLSGRRSAPDIAPFVSIDFAADDWAPSITTATNSPVVPECPPDDEG